MSRSFDPSGFAIRRPRTVLAVMVLSTLGLAVAAALPSVWAPARSVLPEVTVDTDPENMLSEDEPVRVFHHDMKERFGLWDMVVVGVVDEEHPEGVFHADALARIHRLATFAKTLRWPDPDDPSATIGVIEVDLIAPSTVETVEQAGLGAVRFEWLLPQPPATDEEALAIRERARRVPFLDGTLLSEDGKAIALYVPLTSKDLAHRVATELEGEIAAMRPDGATEEYHITGLPVAEDTFGVEMFKQMAISAPVAMLVIFILMWIFFRKLELIIPPMIVAMVSAITTMALLVVTGNTIHIMSSMIPIFIMPIAVLDAIHIISDFFERYGETRDRRATVRSVMKTLFAPMLFTSLTTTAGFASLALTPIPPVQTFGVFIAIGVLLAWFWTITFIPAAIVLIPERRLASLAAIHEEGEGHGATPMGRLLDAVGRFTVERRGVVIAGTLVVAAIAAFGISKIQINDNPTRWFRPDHPIRVADRVLNAHFGGTYMGYLTFEGEPRDVATARRAIGSALTALAAERDDLEGLAAVEEAVRAELARRAPEASGGDALTSALAEWVSEQADAAPDERYDTWLAVSGVLDIEDAKSRVFQRPDVLEYVSALQSHLLEIEGKEGSPVVGKSSSVADVVKTVHRELLLGADEEYRIPDSSAAVAQVLLTYQNSHRPQDLWHFVTPDYTSTSLWVQLKSGDNRDMAVVTDAVEDYVAAHPPPVPIAPKWFGLTYINVIWQQRMVAGMLEAFLGSFVVVLAMMVLLFRSFWWGLLSMIPLTITVAAIYGLIGLIGKDYDMPVAVLSSLSLGLAIDYAIHFLSRARAATREHGSWRAAAPHVFGEPARAITRNAIVVGVGFLPLLLAPLVPYQTVGFFIALILLSAGAATLLILPALIGILERRLFPGRNGDRSPAPSSGTAPTEQGAHS